MALKIEPISPSSKRGRVGTSLSEINVTPFIDVMLVLLVIFMVTAPLMQSGIGVNLPQAETASAPAEEGLTITITKDRFIHMGSNVININLLERNLEAYFAGKQKKVVFIAGDEAVPYGFIVDIFDILKKAGVQGVGILTEPKDIKPSAQRK
jgi:biopolymer transport protein TolR